MEDGEGGVKGMKVKRRRIKRFGLELGREKKMEKH